MEEIKHMLGLCGEPHPSLLWLLSSGGVILYIVKHKVSWCWKKGCQYCKIKLFKKIKK